MNVEQVKEAVESTGSIRAAAIKLGVAYTSLQWWLATKGYKVEKRAVLVKRKAGK